MESPYDVLGVEPSADEETVKQAYRQRVKETHPDQGGSVTEFQLIKAAYEEIEARMAAGETLSTNGDAPPSTNGTSPGSREGPRTTAARDSGEEDAPGWQERVVSRVEYLDYEALDDHGWSLDDDDLFETAAGADLDEETYGTLEVQPRESLLEAAERAGFAWPFACRGGACANCAIVILEGDLETRVDHVLPQEMVDRGIQLSCNGIPTSDELKVVYNVKHMPDLEDLLLPPRPFEQAHTDD